MGKVKMDLSKLPLFRMMSEKMKWLSSRQGVLSQNIANADTPKYRPMDLKKLDFREPDANASFNVALARTNPAHISGGNESQDFQSDKEKDPYETLPTGNSVVLEEQLMKVAQNQHDYELMTELYHKHMQMFTIALDRNGQ